MAIGYVIALFLLILVSLIFTFLRRRRAKKMAERSTSALPSDAEVSASLALAPEIEPPEASLAPEDSPENVSDGKETGAIGEAGSSFETQKTVTAFFRIQALPPLKRAVLWSEILKAPRGLEPPE